MKAVRYDGGDERRVLIGFVTCAPLLARFAPLYTKPGPFPSTWANLVAGWCVEHYRRYGMPIAGAITHAMARWATKPGNPPAEETLRLVERFIASLSDEYERTDELNTDHLIDQTTRLFRKTALKRLRDKLEACLDSDDVDGADELVRSYRRLEAGSDATVDLLQDRDALRQAFETPPESLVAYPNGLGKFFGHSLARDCLIAFQAPEKRGKSQWLFDLAVRAVKQRRKVAYFQTGDLSQSQQVRRAVARLSQRPLHDRPYKYPASLTWGPRDEHGRRVAVCSAESRRHDDPLDDNVVWKTYQKFVARHVRSKLPYFKLHCVPSFTLSVRGIEGLLRDWYARDGWTPDCVVIDYADILDVEHGKLEGRDRTNATWAALRALAQKFHCLTVTATQANAEAYRKSLQDMRNFSEDKRKNAHVSGLVGINQSDADKETGLYRVNWLNRREEDFDAKRCCYVASCLAASMPAVRSLF